MLWRQRGKKGSYLFAQQYERTRASHECATCHPLSLLYRGKDSTVSHFICPLAFIKQQCFAKTKMLNKNWDSPLSSRKHERRHYRGIQSISPLPICKHQTTTLSKIKSQPTSTSFWTWRGQKLSEMAEGRNLQTAQRETYQSREMCAWHKLRPSGFYS